MNVICKQCTVSFEINSEDVVFYKRFGVVHPKLCPSCRAQLRLSFRNERAFYHRPCDKCQKPTISMYSQNKPYVVWCYDCWFADDWGGEDYALSYDPARSFFDQLYDLFLRVPKLGLIYTRSPGSSYTNISADNKNCYFIIESSNNEDSIHSYWIQECREVLDTSFASKCELCYECDDCYSCYRVCYSKGAHDCRNSSFLFDCRGCSDCLGCVNLRQKQYCIFNEQYSKTEYQQKLEEYALDTREGVKAFNKEFQLFLKNQPRKYAETSNIVNSTGNYLKNVKNCRNVFHAYDAEDNAYGVHIWRNAKDTMDCDTAGRNANCIYNSINSGMDTSNQIACQLCWSSTFMSYCISCFNSNNCFGCIGLRKKNYAILNKEYSKEEYETLVEIIITELKQQEIFGDFFPKEFSCFGYNESAVMEQFPLTKEEALAKGFKWEDTPRGTYGKETKQWSEIPSLLSDVNFDSTKEVFACVSCSKNYKIIGNELLIYQKLSLPLPDLCPECRHSRRFLAHGPNKIWQRSCLCQNSAHGHNGKCENEFETAYLPDNSELICCEQCYQAEVL